MTSPVTARRRVRRSVTSSTTPWSSWAETSTTVSPTEYQPSRNIVKPAIRSTSTRWAMNAADEDREHASGDRREPVDAAGQLCDREDRREREGDVGDRRADDPDRGLLPLDLRPSRARGRASSPRAGGRARRRTRAATDGARARDEPGEREQRRDHDDASPGGIERRLVVEEVDHGVENASVLEATERFDRRDGSSRAF